MHGEALLYKLAWSIAGTRLAFCQNHNLRGLLGDAQRLLRQGRFPIRMNRYLFCCIFSLASGVLCILLAVRSPRMSLWDVGGYLFGSIGLGCLIPLLRPR